MPNRILRDWTDSDKVNQLSTEAEVFFVRLIMKADDFGRFHAEVKRLKAACFPLKDSIRGTDISRWLQECDAINRPIEGLQGTPAEPILLIEV